MVNVSILALLMLGNLISSSGILQAAYIACVGRYRR